MMFTTKGTRTIEIVDRIKRLCKAHAISVEQAAIRASIGTVYIRGWLVGNEAIPDEHISNFACYFGIDKDKLINGIDDKEIRRQTFLGLLEEAKKEGWIKDHFQQSSQ